jgi:hypothetical protein
MSLGGAKLDAALVADIASVAQLDAVASILEVVYRGALDRLRGPR